MTAIRERVIMKKYGLVGKKLTHSFSKDIHSKLADYKYDLIELTEEDLERFFVAKEFSAVNVTIPYKQTVIPYLDTLSEVAERIGAVNTVVNKNGKLYGYNTDYYGMKALIEHVGLNLHGKKVLVLGTGGTSKTARVVAQDMGASEIIVVSRKDAEGVVTYDKAVSIHSDADVIINTTPAGMYPDCEFSPIDISCFYKLEGVVDAVYNPICTNLVLDARARGIKAEGGLFMLVMQAVVAVERFIDVEIDKETACRVYADVLSAKQNIVLTGMPGCGKSTIGKLLNVDGYTFIDTDAEIEARCGCSIKELIESKGEVYFRDLESEVIRDVSSESCRIISTGGGAVLRDANVRCLKRNGTMFFINADLARLCATDDRPLSNTREKLVSLYKERMPIYERTADVTVPNMQTPEAEAEYILSKRMELIL